jgi:hypothetical protein
MGRGAKKKKKARIMMVTHKFDHKNLAFFSNYFRRSAKSINSFEILVSP